jgi:hypothetical protein
VTLAPMTDAFGWEILKVCRWHALLREIRMARHADGPGPAEESRDTLGGPDPGGREDELGGPAPEGATDTLGGPDPGGREDELGGPTPEGATDTLDGPDPGGREDEISDPARTDGP